MLFYMAISNWKVWGDDIYSLKIKWSQLFDNKVSTFGLPIIDSKLYFVVVLIVTLLADIYSHFLQYYMSILMWSASIAVLNIVRQADHLFGQKGCFNLKKVQVYRQNGQVHL
jgi:hypothetical protein